MEAPQRFPTLLCSVSLHPTTGCMTAHRRTVGVVIAAGGRGDRAGAGDLKQFREIAGVPMLLRAIRPFAAHPRVDEIVVSLPPATVSDPPAWLKQLVGRRMKLVAGGDTRAASVARGVAVLSAECATVLVHDAARPFVSRETIDAVLEHACRGTCAIAAVPVTDTIKRTDHGGTCVVETIERAGLWRAQTPQGFPRNTLEIAYEAAGESSQAATDEAALVEAAGFTVELVTDSATNMKITTSEDFAIAEALAIQ